MMTPQEQQLIIDALPSLVIALILIYFTWKGVKFVWRFLTASSKKAIRFADQEEQEFIEYQEFKKAKKKHKWKQPY